MKKAPLIAAFLAGSLIMATIGGAAAWWVTTTLSPSEPRPPRVEVREYKYLNLDKIIVMLRADTGRPLSHYLALDLVFKVPAENERTVKQHLPLLRSIAVRAMSALTYEEAGRMSVDDFTATINMAYELNYADEPGGKPFDDVMIGKLIIE